VGNSIKLVGYCRSAAAAKFILCFFMIRSLFEEVESAASNAKQTCILTLTRFFITLLLCDDLFHRLDAIS